MRIILVAALTTALVACGSGTPSSEAVPSPAPASASVRFDSDAALGAWLSTNGFTCTHDDAIGGVYMCTYAGGTDSWQWQVANVDTNAKRKAMCDGGLIKPESRKIAGQTWVLYSGHGDDKLPAMLDTVKTKGLADGSIGAAC